TSRLLMLAHIGLLRNLRVAYVRTRPESPGPSSRSALRERLNAAQVQVDAELEQRVLVVLCQSVGKRDDRRILLRRQRLKLAAHFGQHFSPGHPRLRGECRESRFIR